MLVSAVFLAYCDHEALMLGHWPPRGPILQLKGLHVATVAFTSDVLLQESFFVGFHLFLPRCGVWKNCLRYCRLFGIWCRSSGGKRGLRP